MRIGIVVVASFQPTAHADPCRSPRVRTLNVLPLPASIPLRSRLDFGRCVPWHAHPIGPACPGFTFVRCCSMPPASSPHGLAAPGLGRLTTAIPACSCLQLAVATNSLRRGLPPPIQCPCLAHQAPRLQRAAARPWGLTARATEQIRQPCRKSHPNNAPQRDPILLRPADVILLRR